MTQDEILHLSVSNLKDILFQNHVLARQILERSELVNKVMCFIENEREERTRSQTMHMQEEWEAQERERERERQREREEQGRERLRREESGRGGKLARIGSLVRMDTPDVGAHPQHSFAFSLTVSDRLTISYVIHSIVSVSY